MIGSIEALGRRNGLLVRTGLDSEPVRQGAGQVTVPLLGSRGDRRLRQQCRHELSLRLVGRLLGWGRGDIPFDGGVHVGVQVTVAVGRGQGIRGVEEVRRGRDVTVALG